MLFGDVEKSYFYYISSYKAEDRVSLILSIAVAWPAPQFRAYRMSELIS